MIVRDATEADVEAIRTLFNALIPTTTVAWREDEAPAAEMESWYRDRMAAGDPVLVADQAGSVVGYVTWKAFRGFSGYRHTAELTIHIDADHQGNGVGRLLMDALVDRARAVDIHVLVAAIDADNTGSIAFHQRCGFAEVGRMPEVGRKFDRWLDLVLMQRSL